MDAEREATIQEQERLAREGSRLLDVVFRCSCPFFNNIAATQFDSSRRSILGPSPWSTPNPRLLPQVSNLSSPQPDPPTALSSPPNNQRHSQQPTALQHLRSHKNARLLRPR